jgi:NAD(P)-dependent dehydrogenase (short-subunit alcohol dehydrogenase family)
MPAAVRESHLTDKVIVITGASSGIGRATAHAFAEQGAKLVLAARDEASLRDAARECEARGGEAIAIETDVTDLMAVEALASRAVERFGHIDVWINNAAVFAFGSVEDVPADVFERCMKVNFMGYVHGAKAVLPYFKRRDQGVLINVSSLLGKFGGAYLSAYVTTRFAVDGLSQCLRQELRDTNIEVCTVLPASVDTPIYQHAANYTGRKTEPFHPVYPPEQVAATIVDLAHAPRREAIVGTIGVLGRVAHMITPGLFEKVYPTLIRANQLRRESAPPTTGNLYEPQGHINRVHGGWAVVSPGVRQRITRLTAITMGLALPAGIAAWWWRRQSAQTS